MNIQIETTVAATSSNSNLFNGSPFEIAQQNTVVSLGVCAAATGTFITVTCGSRLILAESPPAVQTRFPVVPDEFYYNFIQLAGERMVVSVRNPTGGGVIHRAIANLQPA